MDDNELNQPLSQIFDKVQNPSTRDLAYDLYKKLISNAIYSEDKMIFIIHQLSEFLLSSIKTNKEKESALNLLSLTFYNEKDSATKNIYYRYISPVLSIYQKLIDESNAKMFNFYSNSFGYIIQNLFSEAKKEMEIEDKRAFEIIQGFCLDNINSNNDNNRYCGSCFLIKLIDNCPYATNNSQYMKNIWGNIMNNLEKEDFNAKTELLTAVISLILGTENNFKNFVNPTLCKIFAFLTDDDWQKRKGALNIIYTVLHYCRSEIEPLKDHYISFLKLLKNDKVKEVRDICKLILDKFNDEKVEDRILVTRAPKKPKPKQLSCSSSKEIILEKREKGKEKDRYKKFNTNASFTGGFETGSNTGSSTSRLKKNTAVTNTSSSFVDVKTAENFSATPLKTSRSRRAITPNRITKKKRDVSCDVTISSGTSTNLISKDKDKEKERKKSVINRREDNTFINQKMVIKCDPNHSIFKTKVNQDFFKNAKKQQDIIVVEPKTKKSIVEQQKVEEENEIIVNDNCFINDEEEPSHNKPIDEKDRTGQFTQEDFFVIENNPELTSGGEGQKKFYPGSHVQESETLTIHTEKNDYSSSQPEKKENTQRTPYKKPNSDNTFKYETKYGNNNFSYNSTRSPTYNPTNAQTNNTFNSPTSSNQQKCGVMNKLISEMNSLSAKQLILLDTLDNIQDKTNEEIGFLNQRITSLESTVDKLTSMLNNLQNEERGNHGNYYNNNTEYNPRGNSSYNNYQTRYNYHRKNEDEFE